MSTEELEQKEEKQQAEERQAEERQEEERRRKRKQRIEEMKREKRRRELLFRYGVPGAAIVCALLLIVGIGIAVRSAGDGESREQESSEAIAPESRSADSEAEQEAPAESLQQTEASPEAPAESLQQTEASQQAMVSTALTPAQVDAASLIGPMLLAASEPVFEAHTTENTNGFSDTIISEYGIIIDVESGEVLAQRNGWSRMNPASMTKILTVLVAAENITTADLDDTFVMTIDITDYSFQHDCSNVGFEVGEEIPVRDLFYGTALQSGGDAALGLAIYVAGSQEAFVDMMNAKLEALGLSETTHFTNCVGLYDENHYSTAYDMAVILKEAADNEFCREVLSEHHYVTTPTAEHPDGIDISNWFLRRIEDRDTHGEVLCAKTGYVVQSKNCAASLAADHNGREYICVTAKSDSVWTCIKDQVELYQKYLPE